MRQHQRTRLQRLETWFKDRDGTGVQTVPFADFLAMKPPAAAAERPARGCLLVPTAVSADQWREAAAGLAAFQRELEGSNPMAAEVEEISKRLAEDSQRQAQHGRIPEPDPEPVDQAADSWATITRLPDAAARARARRHARTRR